MSDTPVASHDHDAPIVTGASPTEIVNPVVRHELAKAKVWLGLIAAMALAVLLVQPLLVIFGGLVMAAMLDGGVRLLGRVLPIPRGWRLLIVVLGVMAFLVGTFWLAGVQITQQITQLQATLQVQFTRATAWLASKGIMPGASDVGSMVRQAAGQLGTVTSWLGTAVGALTTAVFILVLGLFFAMEPRIYQRGLQWMVPEDSREEFAITIERMGTVLRRLLAGRLIGMAAEGVLTFVALAIGGVPMALVLGIIAGILAFIPNIGSFITGAIMVAVGFSAGMHTGLWALATWAVVQSFDGYVVVPIVARRTVDLPPALTLSMQILASALFGLLGLMFADPMTAMIKVALERRSEAAEEAQDAQELVGPDV